MTYRRIKGSLLSACFLLLTAHAFAQTKTKHSPVSSASLGDTVVFTARLSGCFNAYTHTYTFVKQKNNDRLLSYKKDSAMVTKLLSARQYDEFVADFKKSYEHFTSRAAKNTCTTVSFFELKGKASHARFTNGACNDAYQPERFLMGFL